MMAKSWRTSVDQLLHTFRRALVSLLPVMEEARIPWKEGEAYDDWDEIAQCLYRNIVARSLWVAVAEERELEGLLPRYNTLCSSYSSNRGFIEVCGVESDQICAFVGFSTELEPFDSVDYVVLNAQREPLAPMTHRARLENVEFRFRVVVEGDKELVFHDMEVEL